MNMNQAAIEAIQKVKARLGDELILLAHHYQRPELTALADKLGDSYELARAARDAKDARFIVFCGVRFMAEAAEVLRRDEQKVFHPEATAGCPLADFADRASVEAAWNRMSEVLGPEAVMPLVYMNSTAELKAFVGKHGGAVCTSSNAGRAFEWAFRERQVVFFLPDEHLGRNTVAGMDIKPEEVVLWDPMSPEGGVEVDRLKKARVILWKGYCHVHTAFTIEDVAWARHKHPKARILVHPECPQPVVQAVDGAGSTSYLVREVAEAAPGETLIIGTEMHLVERLTAQYTDRQVIPLRRSLCYNMARIDLTNLRATMEALPEGPVVQLDEELKADARLALERMLSI